ncbi:reverse transcriptase-like protein, partial [Vibrio vulnificus]|uniref:reverse transcriptase-like protein n=1 Tax=Vibrio vulnificus TaxID=672 RepID=UPI0019D4EDDD
KNEQIPISKKLEFEATNNMAEYEAYIFGLQMARMLGEKEIEVIGDSILVVLQSTGQWAAKDEKMVKYHETLRKVVENFDGVDFT